MREAGLFPMAFDAGNSAHNLRTHALVKLVEIDDDALVFALANRLNFIFSPDPERKHPAIDPGDLGIGPDLHADRGGGEMPDIEHGADGLVTGRHEMLGRDLGMWRPA